MAQIVKTPPSLNPQAGEASFALCITPLILAMSAAVTRPAILTEIVDGE
jgi:hypothetical protein